MTSVEQGTLARAPGHAELSNSSPHPLAQGATPPPSGPIREKGGRKPRKCRFFGTKRGCRSGASCAFLHDISPPRKSAASSRTEPRTKKESSGSPVPPSSISPAESPTQNQDGNLQSKTIQRPVAEAERNDPRLFQINQIRRRFRGSDESDSDGTQLKFTLEPTDPDFHFDIKGLQCVLHVPTNFPRQGHPSLQVLNQDLDSESRALVQRKFDHIVRESTDGTLLRWMNLLDRELEEALTQPPPSVAAESLSSAKKVLHDQRLITDQEEKEKAGQRRKKEITQLTSRLGRDPLFKAGSDGISYTIPIKPLRPDLLPDSLRHISSLSMIVPESYPLDPCRIKVLGIHDENAKALENAFATHALKNPAMSLVAHINFLSTPMHKMATKPLEEPVPAENVSSLPIRPGPAPAPEPARSPSPAPRAPPTEAGPSKEMLSDRPHVHVIPRPPEWTTVEGDGAESDISDDDESWSEGSLSDDDDDESGGVSLPADSTYQSGRRVLLSFPDFELHGVELLSLASLSLTVKCERCKELCDVKNIKIGDDGVSVPATRTQVCSKCSSYLRIGFRRDFMHPSSNRAGTLFLDGCTVVDMLPPSNFIPTCSECDADYLHPGISAVRGDHKMAFCRECHNRMQFKLPELKFLTVCAGEGISRDAVRAPRKSKESLGIVVGQELPRRGRCSHYGRSYRWFRFSCCSRVFPCDKCHDAATDHPNEHANRIICGNCSREQNYRPEDCVFCHAILVGKAGTGFWEGGRGTRNKILMSRKDPRKYKRRGGGAAAGSRQKK